MTLSRSSKAVDFGTNRKRVWYLLLVISRPSNFVPIPILLRVRDTRAFVRRKPLFSYSTAFQTASCGREWVENKLQHR